MNKNVERISVLVPASEKSPIPSLGFAAIQDILRQAFPEITVTPLHVDSAPALNQPDIFIANLYSTLGFMDIQRTFDTQGIYVNGKRTERPFTTIVGGTGALNPLPIKDAVDYIALNEEGLVDLISHLAKKEPRPWKQPNPIWARTDYITLIMPTLGCRYKCVFCQLKNQNNSNVEYSDLDNIKKVIAEEKPKRILVHSANIFQYPFFDELVQELDESRAEIYLGSMNLIDVDEQRGQNLFKLRPKHTIASERDTDVQLYFGLESGSKRVLKKMKKPLTPEIALQKAKILSESGFQHLGFYLIVGYPGTEQEDFNDTAQLLNGIADIMGDDKQISVKCTPFIPHLGTEVSDQPARNWVDCMKEFNWIKNLTRPHVNFDISDPFYYLTSLALIRGGKNHYRLVSHLAREDNVSIHDDESMDVLLKKLRLSDLQEHLGGKAPLDLSFTEEPFISVEQL